MNTDITQTQTTTLNTSVQNFSLNNQNTDGASGEETFWYNDKWTQRYAYYMNIPELKNAIKGYATWITGKGFETDPRTETILEHIKGWGEDNFLAIIWNLLVTKKINGDAYAEIIRDEKTNLLINLKPLDPAKMCHVVNSKGVLKKYKYQQADKTYITFEPDKILHLVNDRIADNIHGDSVIDAIKWAIDARNEAMQDWRRISHRATIRILYIEEDDTSKLTNMKRDYADAINKGELLILPVKAGDAQFQDLTLPPYQAFLDWIRYLENFFYQAIGVPKVVLGGTQENTEASAKVAYTAYEQFYTKEVVDLEADLWNQLLIKIKFNNPASFVADMANSEAKNTGQLGFQANDTQMGVGE